MRLHHLALQTKTFTFAKRLDFMCTQGLSDSVTVMGAVKRFTEIGRDFDFLGKFIPPN